MSAEKYNSNPGNRRRILSTAFAALLATGATTANAQEKTTTIEHECPMPLIGDYVLTSEITTDMPSTITIGEETGPIQIDMVTTLPDTAREGLTLAQGDTLEGTAEVMNTMELPNRDKALNASLEIPRQNIPNESGPFSINASGTVPSQFFGHQDAGQGRIVLDDLILEQQVRGVDGELLGDPIGEFTSDCTMISGDNVLQEFEIISFGLWPIISVDPNRLDFGRTVPGDRTLSVTVSNLGNDGLGVNDVTIEGPDADAFIQNNNCTTVAPNASCTVEVTYMPSGFDPQQSATLKIDSTDNTERAEEEERVPLTGVPGIEPLPDITVDPESVNFGVVDPHAGPVSREVVVGNEGNSSLNITEIHVQGDSEFFVQETDCTTVHPESDSCGILVGFFPGESDASFTGTLSIASNDSGSPEEITLSGETVGFGPKPVGMNLDGHTVLQASDADIPLSGLFTAVVDIAAGDVRGDMQLDPSTAEFRISRLFRTIKGRADIEFEPVGETTGTLSDGTLAIESQFNIKVPKARVVIFGKELRIGGGMDCRTSEPVTVPLESQDDFLPLEGGSLSGTYDLPPLEHCGILTDVLNKFLAGPGNTIEVNMTPEIR